MLAAKSLPWERSTDGRPGETELVYPETDGKPMAENTIQQEWIITLITGLNALVPDFVAGDLFWYPVEGRPAVVQAPDAFVAFGRPKGHRRSYRQWEEGGIAPQVVFEVLSPSNTLAEMTKKFIFYDLHGVEEYYILDPEGRSWIGYTRVDGRLADVPSMDGWVSPRLKIRFGYEGSEPAVWGPSGARFRTVTEIVADELSAQARAEAERARADALAARLRELGVEL